MLLLILGSFQGFAGTVIVTQWNGYTAPAPGDGQFKAKDGVVANRKTAVLTRDVSAVTSNYAVNADGVAASSGWADAENTEKYWIATFSTAGYENLTLTSKQTGSNSGPADFKIQYKTASDENWTDLSDGEITVGNDNYTSGVVIDLELPAKMFDQPEVSLRWLCTSTVRISGTGTVATSGVNRLDATIGGTAKSGVVDPRISVSADDLRFNVQLQQKSFTVTGENLTEPISITSTSSSFLPGVNSLPADASDAVVNVRFFGTVNETGVITLSSGPVTETVHLTAIVSGTENDGSEKNPYTIAEIQKNQGSSTAYYWVKGYIIGCLPSGSTTFNNPEFTAPFTSATNLLIADDPDENDKLYIVPIQLPTETVAPGVRAGLNLSDKPANRGKQVKIEGTLEAYFGMPGVRNARAYTFNMTNINSHNDSALTVYADNGIIYIKNLPETERINIYDLTGRLIIQTFEREIPLDKGIYMVSPLTPEGGMLAGNIVKVGVY